MPEAAGPYVVGLDEVTSGDLALVGGKNASLGEMIRNLSAAGIRVPDGFATTVRSYRALLATGGLHDRIAETLDRFKRGKLPLERAGSAIRKAILATPMPDDVRAAVADAYARLCKRVGRVNVDVAVRSSATAEDLPDASFAGQQESFLNVRGAEAVLRACRRCMASLFTDRAISYREHHGFDHMRVGLSVGVQRMVRSDKGAAGVMFSIGPETGFPGALTISANWGLGESVVSGSVDPDEFMVAKAQLADQRAIPVIQRRRGRKLRKVVYGTEGSRVTRNVRTTAREQGSFALGDADAVQLARWGVAIEKHYGRPMDIEWAKDGITGELFIVQARPETVQSRAADHAFRSYKLKGTGRRIVSGTAVGQAIVTGRVCARNVPGSAEAFPAGAILVADKTDPDWVPVMRRAGAIVTDHGGRTSHAAIVSRELALPAIVGARGATRALKNGAVVTVSCAEGDTGYVYEGRVPFEVRDVSTKDLPATRTRVMLNVGDPATALRWWRLPADGVGLARMEFVIGNLIKAHPLALLYPKRVREKRARDQIAALTSGYADGPSFFIDTLAHGIACIAVVHHPRPVIVRLSDFKTNEYADLIGGRDFEPVEANPMLGWRGASRYYSDAYRDGFALECRAIRKAREELGFTNVVVMVPFCRTLTEADLVLREMAMNGLERGKGGLEVYVMCEIPSNVILASEFADRFDGFSIGSNDLTQLTLGVDRDSALLAGIFSERDPAVTRLIARVIEDAHAKGRPVGLCGQGPSDSLEFAEFLVSVGIDSMSVTPDSFIQVKRQVAVAERSG
ncbi:MAG: phosphoenolpyruvate synthase [Gemmatimonadaceae bacterium]|nr:phosphoenolpyruvate synthase [Gemmatimonadaceae bacterium]